MLRALSGGGAYPTAIRWLVVYKRLWLGHDADTVTRALEGISAHCQSDILKRYYETGDVRTWQGQGASQPSCVTDAEAHLWLLGVEGVASMHGARRCSCIWCRGMG